jgi:Virulence-associated protein E
MTSKNVVPLRPTKKPLLPAATEFRDWLDKKQTQPAPSLWNTRVALNRLGIGFSHNLFDGKKYIGGIALNNEVGGQVTDDAVTALRIMVRDKFDFDPGPNTIWSAVNLFCRENGYHPVKDYLESVRGKWSDFEPSRLDTMLIDYFGAPDTPFVRAVSRIVMVASVRRIYAPGSKFDYLTVLESPEGYNKSTAIETLYGREWFTSNSILGLSNERLQEAVTGFWVLECADLSGMKKAEVERVKDQLSKYEDNTRGAYKRATVRAPRSVIFWGTTNDKEYLRSQTGNRRFFPIKVGRIDLDRLAADRDVLWSEALAAHEAGEKILLDETLWADASVEQDKRTIKDPWDALTANISDLAERYEEHRTNDNEGMMLGVVYQCDRIAGRERVTSAFVLTKVLGILPAMQTPEHGKRAGQSLRRQGWEGPDALWIGGRTVKGYERKLLEPEGSNDNERGDWE